MCDFDFKTLLAESVKRLRMLLDIININTQVYIIGIFYHSLPPVLP